MRHLAVRGAYTNTQRDEESSSEKKEGREK